MDNTPILSKRISAKTRVYYIDVHADRKNQRYITISEIPTDRNPQKRSRQRVFIHAENIDKFLEAIQEVSETIKKNGS